MPRGRFGGEAAERPDGGGGHPGLPAHWIVKSPPGSLGSEWVCGTQAQAALSGGGGGKVVSLKINRKAPTAV